ncbi:uncharacterized protein LOC121406501 [Lytechinus variegatus]|uniref:uncharacterized protein LOC121406501 n=1 Tax=Lytechinus variegatus TaxID=7654 RepID=UPI001BB1CFE0|nr:uncharacterized protein LOC121406501 [Lytechinus variegatus]
MRNEMMGTTTSHLVIINALIKLVSTKMDKNILSHNWKWIQRRLEYTSPSMWPGQISEEWNRFSSGVDGGSSGQDNLAWTASADLHVIISYAQESTRCRPKLGGPRLVTTSCIIMRRVT